MEGIFIRRKPLLAVVISGMCALLAARFGEWFVRAVSRHEDAFTSVICGIFVLSCLGSWYLFSCHFKMEPRCASRRYGNRIFRILPLESENIAFSCRYSDGACGISQSPYHDEILSNV